MLCSRYMFRFLEVSLLVIAALVIGVILLSTGHTVAAAL